MRDAVALALYLKENHIRPEQVQDFSKIGGRPPHVVDVALKAGIFYKPPGLLQHLFRAGGHGLGVKLGLLPNKGADVMQHLKRRLPGFFQNGGIGGDAC